MRGEFKAWRDAFAATPRKADYAWTTLARLMSFAKDRGIIATNPCEKGGRLYAADRSNKVWGEPEIGAVLAVASEELKLALVLQIATFTGHSLKDVEAILDAHYLGRDFQLAEAAVLKLEKRTEV